MNNLMTRRIVLGMLMTFVLVFSVQGIAEAQTIEVTSGNHQTKKAGETFSITLKLTELTGAADTDGDGDSDDYELDVSFNASLTLTTTSGIDGNNLEIANVNSNSTYTRSLTYRVNNNATADTLTATTLGNATVYIVADSAISATAPTVASATAGYRIGVSEVSIRSDTGDVFTIADDLPLRYSVSGGTLYVQDGSTSGRTISSSQIISSSAPVMLKMNGRTSIVSVYIEGHGSNRSARTTIIYRFPRLSKVSGDNPKQSGAPSSRVRLPFTVQVRDGGSGTTGRPCSWAGGYVCDGCR